MAAEWLCTESPQLCGRDASKPDVKPHPKRSSRWKKVPAVLALTLVTLLVWL
eukprot:CAMPEP_0171140278 /NCGR_PEP_ID=MMETSP0766_2-20121228/138414_1 /TAXON_ID=439317 /ORGANISM="Gambierdiscus australes, Strain CAWD 149" /LENGTH=51 /DNA_ID=CAMNT_0011603961 /DNA_START=39 /DNA_END=191 /DNA_ORIENTATION=-